MIIELRLWPDQSRQINDLPPAEVLAKDSIGIRSRGVTSGMGNLLGGLEHRAEGLERQRALLRREVRAEEQHREGGTGLVPAPKSPPRLGRGAVDDQLLE